MKKNYESGPGGIGIENSSRFRTLLEGVFKSHDAAISTIFKGATYYAQVLASKKRFLEMGSTLEDLPF